MKLSFCNVLEACKTHKVDLAKYIVFFSSLNDVKPFSKEASNIRRTIFNHSISLNPTIQVKESLLPIPSKP